MHLYAYPFASMIFVSLWAGIFLLLSWLQLYTKNPFADRITENKIDGQTL